MPSFAAGDTPLIVLCRRGNMTGLKVMLQHRKAWGVNIHATNHNGENAAYVAAKSAYCALNRGELENMQLYLQCVEALKQAGADLEYIHHDGQLAPQEYVEITLDRQAREKRAHLVRTLIISPWCKKHDKEAGDIEGDDRLRAYQEAFNHSSSLNVNMERHRSSNFYWVKEHTSRLLILMKRK
jgi:hypothetical protein